MSLFHSSGSPDSARQIWAAGLDQEAVFHMDSALSLYRHAIQADPEYLPAHLSRMSLLRKSGRAIELRKIYEVTSSPAGFALCLNAIAWGVSSHDVPEALARYKDLLRKQGRTPCTEVARVSLNAGYEISPLLLRDALRTYGYAPLLMRQLYGVLKTAGANSSRLGMFRSQIAKALTPTMAFSYESALVDALQIAGEWEAARDEVKKITSEFARDPRPYVRWQLLALNRSVLVRGSPDFAPRWRTASAEMRAIARRNHADPFEFDALLVSSIEDIDRGDLTSAIRTLDEAVQIAKKTKSPDLQMFAFANRGRALAAQGRQNAAITDLLHSASAARLLGERYRLAEAYHQMAHAYEAHANWAKAVAAADSFVSIGATVRDKSMRMIRLSDAAAIHWKASYHTRANQLYVDMVRTIDADSANYEYAGAYFERTGDLARAAQYYRKAYEVPGTASAKLALGGLTRINEQLGFLDSAVASAKKHDALVLTPEREILLPRLLARQGRTAEAIGQAERWVNVQLLRGSPAGTASAINQHAELLLDSNPRAALALLVKADSFARVVNSIPDIVAAQRLRGLAKAQLGDFDNGMRDIVAALSLTRKMQDVFLPVTLTTDIAILAAKAARPRTALTWYAKANDALRSATTNFDDPVLIARFRNARQAIFDGAIRTIFELPDSERTKQFLEWSERKKGHSRMAQRRAAKVPTPGYVLLDYLTVGDTLVVSVISARGSQTILLPVSAAAVADIGRRLVAPLRETHNGNVDIGRAVFSLGLAHTLYEGLLAPVETLIHDAKTVVIVPDVPLQLIPFDALVLKAATGNDDRYFRSVYAADKWTITYAPTVDAARKDSRARSYSGQKVLFVAHMAPGVDRERGAIQSVWPASGMKQLIGVNATESRVRHSDLSQIVHFATHAISDDIDPLRSHLVLEPELGNDGLMHANEIRRLHWSRSLVFLSSCETATGPMFAGTGTLSLARAFMDGGAGTVIATQWPVGAISSELARDFYTGLASGRNASEALHSAKRRIRKNRQTAHPFFWASHILISGTH